MLSVFMCFIAILSSSLNAMLTVDKHCSDVGCDKFLMLQTDRKSKQVKEHTDMENFICNQYGEKLASLNTENINQSCALRNFYSAKIFSC